MVHCGSFSAWSAYLSSALVSRIYALARVLVADRILPHCIDHALDIAHHDTALATTAIDRFLWQARVAWVVDPVRPAVDLALVVLFVVVLLRHNDRRVLADTAGQQLDKEWVRRSARALVHSEHSTQLRRLLVVVHAHRAAPCGREDLVEAGMPREPRHAAIVDGVDVLGAQIACVQQRNLAPRRVERSAVLRAAWYCADACDDTPAVRTEYHVGILVGRGNPAD